MRNRAKCKLCGDLVESFFKDDLVSCGCGEISISGGAYHLWSRARKYDNFLRIDDDDQEYPEFEKEEDLPKLATKNDLIDEFCRMVESDGNLPEKAWSLPVSQYDLGRYMLILKEIVKRVRD